MIDGQSVPLGAFLGITPTDDSTIRFISMLIDDTYIGIDVSELYIEYCTTKGYAGLI